MAEPKKRRGYCGTCGGVTFSSDEEPSTLEIPDFLKKQENTPLLVEAAPPPRSSTSPTIHGTPEQTYDLSHKK